MSSDSNFENKLMKGYEKHISRFNKWCEYASPILGEIGQCGIIELNSDGTAYIAANRPDIGEQNLKNKWYLYEPGWTFYKNPTEDISTFTTQIGYENSKIFIPEYRFSWFFHREILEENNTQRIYFFGAKSVLIYEKIVNNRALVKKMLQAFKIDNQDIINYQQDHRINLAARSTNYFSVNNVDKTDREKINDLLHVLGLLDKDAQITEREWQCIKMLEFGKSSRETGEILGISRRTVETHFSNLKQKLMINSKEQILEIHNIR